MRPWLWQLLGLALFLFIPLVLYLFVAHPQPIALSLVLGVLLMLGHRFLARPYMTATARKKCLWCNRVFASAEPSVAIALLAGGSEIVFAACPGHDRPALRFLSWVDRLRLPLAVGIGVPLVALLLVLGVAAAGRPAPTALATDLFRLVVGLTVNVAALGAWLGPSHGTGASTLRAAFPPHNFSLLGIRSILWIFRGVGVYWIWTAGRALAETLTA